ncbi:MAG: hypothetical protein HC836_23280 [Richelia sp. RM2_1_2]|nr:hypothetical protein [Richelia sp. RM2_1_2]
MDVSDLTIFSIRSVLKGNPIVVTHRDQDKFVILPLELLTLLEGLQFEELEQEDGAYDEIKDILRNLDK